MLMLGNRCTHNHLSVGHCSKFFKHAVGILCIENQKRDSIADHFFLHWDQVVGHGKHLNNIGSQPEKREEMVYNVSDNIGTKI